MSQSVCGIGYRALLVKKIKSVTSVRNAQMRVTDFDSEKKRIENYSDFKKLTHIIGHDLQGVYI